jgi:TRAP-type C4-dicarboxylate transport system permease small subunit
MENRSYGSSFFDRIIDSAAMIASLALAVMMLIGAADVIFENTLNQPIPGTLEATEALMVIVVFLALARTQQRRGHIRVDLVTGRMGPEKRRWARRLGHGLSAVFYGLLAIEGTRYAWRSISVREYVSGLFPFPVYPAKTVMAIGLAVMAFQCLRQMIASRDDGNVP